jgi:hypothetical protein
MKITHYTIRDIKALDGVPAAAPEWDVVAKVTNGTCFYSDQTFDDLQEANRFITKQMIEPEPFEYWEGQPLEQLHLSRIPHDAWIMNVPVGYTPEQRATIARTGKAPSARVTAEECVVMEHHEPKLTMEAMRLSVYHSDTEIKLRDDGIYGDDAITLWKIRGVPRTLYPTKMAAEVAARAHFPHDASIVRYSRITFIEVGIEAEKEES